jgi:hypothetical protein
MQNDRSDLELVHGAFKEAGFIADDRPLKVPSSRHLTNQPYLYISYHFFPLGAMSVVALHTSQHITPSHTS